VSIKGDADGVRHNAWKAHSRNDRDDRDQALFAKTAGEGNMRRISAWFSFSLCVGALGGAAQTARLVFLSTQLPLIEETQEFRNLILKGFSRDIDYLTELPQQFPVCTRQSCREHAQSTPLDDRASRLTGRGITNPLLALGNFGKICSLGVEPRRSSGGGCLKTVPLHHLPALSGMLAGSANALRTFSKL
jgi:hypothetical protein